MSLRLAFQQLRVALTLSELVPLLDLLLDDAVTSVRVHRHRKALLMGAVSAALPTSTLPERGLMGGQTGDKAPSRGR